MATLLESIKQKRIFLSAALVFAFTSCSAGVPTTLVSSTSPLSPGVRGTVEAYGSDCQFFLLGLIPVTSSPNSQNALDRAKRSANVDVLTDVTVDHGGAYYILFSNSCIRVRGKGVERATLKANDLAAPATDSEI